MKHPITKKSLVGLLSAALIAAFTAVIPSTANATEGCTDQSAIVGKKNVGFEKCTGLCEGFIGRCDQNHVANCSRHEQQI